jgi:hypothetical protein
MVSVMMAATASAISPGSSAFAAGCTRRSMPARLAGQRTCSTERRIRATADKQTLIMPLAHHRPAVRNSTPGGQEGQLRVRMVSFPRTPHSSRYGQRR